MQTSYFSQVKANKSDKKQKASDVHSKISLLADHQKQIIDQQLLALQEKRQREKELHELLMTEKQLDLKIKEKQLQLLEKQFGM